MRQLGREPVEGPKKKPRFKKVLKQIERIDIGQDDSPLEIINETAAENDRARQENRAMKAELEDVKKKLKERKRDAALAQ